MEMILLLNSNRTADRLSNFIAIRQFSHKSRGIEALYDLTIRRLIRYRTDPLGDMMERSPEKSILYVFQQNHYLWKNCLQSWTLNVTKYANWRARQTEKALSPPYIDTMIFEHPRKPFLVYWPSAEYSIQGDTVMRSIYHVLIWLWESNLTVEVSLFSHFEKVVWSANLLTSNESLKNNMQPSRQQCNC